MNGKLKTISSCLRIFGLLFAFFVALLSVLWILSISDVNQGAWTTIGFLYVFAPLVTIVGLLFLILPSFFLHRITQKLEDRYAMWIGIVGTIIIYIETIVLLLLPLGMTK